MSAILTALRKSQQARIQGYAPVTREYKPSEPPSSEGPQVIVIGCEKGGTGKSTTAMHVMVALMKRGLRVGSIDLDSRQGSLSGYVANRRAFAAESGSDLTLPRHVAVLPSEAAHRCEAEAAEQARLDRAIVELADCDIIVVDTPGSSAHLSRLAHARADTLITPINDSFLDIAVLAVVDRKKREVLGPSIYTRMVWAQNERRTGQGRAPVDWIVMRNRLAHIDARNKRDISGLLGALSQRIGCRLVTGFGERVVFRELYLNGLTVLDLPESDFGRPALESHHAARREVEELLLSIDPMVFAAVTPSVQAS